MESIATENLFLLEFLVDNVDLGQGCDCDSPSGELCISFQFLDNAPLDVCENDFSSAQGGKDVKTGKSCLFSLTPTQAEEATKQFDIYVSVVKKMQPGWLPEKVEIGNTLISVCNLFNELIESVGCGCESSPCAKTLKDSFGISSSEGEEIGSISVYIRMSCFGKLIVTQFQMNLEDKSVLFKDKDGKSMYRYKKASKKGSIDVERTGTPASTVWSAAPPCNPNCPQVSCNFGGGMGGGGGGMGGGGAPPCVAECPTVSCPRHSPYGGQPPAFPPPPPGGGFPPQMMDRPCNECGMPPQNLMGPQNGMGMQRPCNECGVQSGQQPVPEDPNASYQEIGAEMGGNALTIRVHKDANKIEQMDDTGGDVADGECCCTVQNFGKKKKQEQNYNLQPGVDKNAPFSFKMGGCGQAAQNNVTVVPPTCTAADGMQYTELSDPDRDVFILRIGKKSEGANKKSNLELELCTPKGPDLKPTPKKETRDTQYDEKDAGESTGGGGGGKGGKAKGGKKGKKK